ncbi:MAG: hypothetical protein RIM23_07270 [Coleofasciculus sp. G3-WIS-01]|uniref:hypothetical protein n=1 Tax=Coleofasciculus sp. G3-WIS-01 TaxID=3069528 RepID=UPI0032F5FD51
MKVRYVLTRGLGLVGLIWLQLISGEPAFSQTAASVGVSCSGGGDQCVPLGDFSDFSGSVMGGGISCANGSCESSGFSFSCTNGECNNPLDEENFIRDKFEYSPPMIDPVPTFDPPSFISPLAPDQIEAEGENFSIENWLMK